MRNEMSYFDLSERERASLTLEQLERFLELDRMEAGILKPVKPEVLERADQVDDAPPLESKMFFQVGDLVFADRDEAALVLALRPMRADYDYGGAGYAYKFPIDVPDREIVIVQLFDRDEVTDRGQELREIREQREAIDKARQTYETERDAWASQGSEIREDVAGLLEKTELHARILSTFDTYLVTTNGDETMALRFLAKAFHEADILEAIEWSDGDVDGVRLALGPVVEEEDVAEAPAEQLVGV